MDAGLQEYGGKLFSALRAKGDTVFISLPPPTPQPKAVQSQAASASAAAPAPNMSTYYAGAGGGCFHADALVECASAATAGAPSLSASGGAPTRIADICTGDLVRVAGGWSNVRCVVQLARASTKPLAQLPDGLLITPRHPVRVGGKWMPAQEVPGAQVVRVADCECVYTLVLEDSHVLVVNGVECITWGHSSTDANLAHPFFGSDKVVRALEAMRGFSHGLVRLDGCIRRADGEARASGQEDPVVGLVEAPSQWYAQSGFGKSGASLAGGRGCGAHCTSGTRGGRCGDLVLEYVLSTCVHSGISRKDEN
jgi:hypothetical protein